MSLTPEEAEAERKRFEAWWYGLYGAKINPPIAYFQFLGNGYLSERIEGQWHTWLSAIESERERVRQELPRLIQQYGKVRQEYGRFDAGDDGAAILEKINAILGVS